ncbi:MAG: anti-sigma factor [Acidobacteriota bacterium]
MSCNTPAERISAYLDGELDGSGAAAFEAHLETCGECARRLANLRALRSGLSSPALRAEPAANQERALRATLRAASGSETGKSLASFRRQLLALAAALVLAAVSFGLGQWSTWRTTRSPIVEQVISSHVRSLLAEHLEDIATSDRHTVKPWFEGKLDYAPPVVDLAAAGFPLRGGRLDVIGEERVAALVYQADLHVINLFVWPEPGGASAGLVAQSERGYQLERWSAGGMRYWAVSDASAGRLRAFVLAVRRAVEEDGQASTKTTR